MYETHKKSNTPDGHRCVGRLRLGERHAWFVTVLQQGYEGCGWERLSKLNTEAMKGDRLTIYPKDVQNITGRGLRYAQRMIRVIKRAYGKSKDQFVSINEFCEFSGLTPDEVRRRLK
jgi:hypothetical protein